MPDQTDESLGQQIAAKVNAEECQWCSQGWERLVPQFDGHADGPPYHRLTSIGESAPCTAPSLYTVIGRQAKALIVARNALMRAKPWSQETEGALEILRGALKGSE